jgi:hypothetical protein
VARRPLAEQEAAWRRDSLIRYRWIPVITASSTLWIGITFLALLAGMRKRRQVQRQRREWQELDEASALLEEEAGIEEIRPDPEPR